MAKKYQLPDLPYRYDALEPAISTEIMQIHHQKHHNAYVTNMNSALEKYEEAEKNQDLATMISLQPLIRFNGGGHLNHSLFWTNLAPPSQGGGKGPIAELANEIDHTWGSFARFVEQFQNQASLLQGSGWCWLCYSKEPKQLLIATCANQDPLQSTTGYIPLLGIDVWEHAYYLQYQNRRLDYLKAIWQVVNWNAVQERYQQCKELCASCKS